MKRLFNRNENVCLEEKRMYVQIYNKYKLKESFKSPKELRDRFKDRLFDDILKVIEKQNFRGKIKYPEFYFFIAKVNYYQRTKTILPLDMLYGFMYPKYFWDVKLEPSEIVKIKY